HKSISLSPEAKGSIHTYILRWGGLIPTVHRRRFVFPRARTRLDRNRPAASQTRLVACGDPNSAPRIESRIRRWKIHAAPRQDAATLFPHSSLLFGAFTRTIARQVLFSAFPTYLSLCLLAAAAAAAARFRVPSEGGCGASNPTPKFTLADVPQLNRNSPVRIFLDLSAATLF
ncbi:hypothetical protein BHM03_00061215, partial [Ensete ventricosum]